MALALGKESFTPRHHLLGPCERLLDAARVYIYVSEGGGNVGMPHQDADGLHWNSGLPQVSGEGSPEPVRVYVLHTGPLADVLKNELDSSGREARIHTCVTEEWSIGGSFPASEILTEVVLRSLVKIADPLFVSLAEDYQLIGSEVDVFDLQGGAFRDTAAGRIKEFHQRPVTERPA